MSQSRPHAPPTTRRDRIPLRRLVIEWLDDSVGADGRLWRTVGRLLTSPGALAESYLSGSDRYIRPTRLYLLASLVLFGLTSAADPGAALGEAMLALERGWLASGDPAATRELEADLERLALVARTEGQQAEQRAERLDRLLADVRRGERHADAAAAVAAPSAGADDAEPLGSWIEDPYLAEEDLARAQSAIAGRLLEWLPFLLIFLVPVHAAGIHGLARGRGTEERPTGVTAVVLSIYGHAFAFTGLSVAVALAWATGWSAEATLVGPVLVLVAVLVWQAAAIRRVYGSTRRRAATVSAAWGVVYGSVMALVFGLAYAVALVIG